MGPTEYVMLNSDSSAWIAGKWAVLGTTLTGVGTGFAWLKRVSHTVSTEQDLIDYIESYNNNQGVPDKSKLSGILGEYQVVSISDISSYRRNLLRTENMPMSVYPVG